VTTRDPWWETKQLKKVVKRTKVSDYEPISLPKNTPVGMYIAAAAFLMGFGLIWHIWWLAVISLLALIVIVIWKTHDEDSEMTLSAKEVFEIDQKLRGKQA
jgi:cytochrome o ubiquinol oxidase subunit 1